MYTNEIKDSALEARIEAMKSDFISTDQERRDALATGGKVVEEMYLAPPSTGMSSV